MKIPTGALCQAQVNDSNEFAFCGQPATTKLDGKYLCSTHYNKIVKPNTDEILESVEIDGYIWASMCAKLGIAKDAGVNDFDEALEKLTSKTK